jgi:hypothetical protein
VLRIVHAVVLPDVRAWPSPVHLSKCPRALSRGSPWEEDGGKLSLERRWSVRTGQCGTCATLGMAVSDKVRPYSDGVRAQAVLEAQRGRQFAF